MTAAYTSRLKEVVLATSNAGKIREFGEMLAPLSVRAQSEFGVCDAEETGLSFIENALIKARHAAHVTKLPAMADDSGLVVPSLGGQPGIYSARYAGINASNEQNITKLLAALDEDPSLSRRAYFYCAIVFLEHASSPTPIIAVGTVSGEISLQPSGTGGFGYDPIFFLPSSQCTMAELDPAEKHRISHRGKALRNLLQLMHVSP